MTVRLFVGNLPYDVTEPELRAYFAAVGPLASLALPLDRDTGTPRGFAFVEFQARPDAEEAIRRLHAQVFQGRPLAVSEARAREAQAPPRAARPGAPRPPGAADDPAGPAGAAPPSASPRGGGLKACDALKAEIQAKLVAKGLTDATLTILPRGDLPGHAVMGRCEGNTKMIVLTRSPPAP